MTRALLASTLACCLACALPSLSSAALYTYVDGRGVRHYTNAPADVRYKPTDKPIFVPTAAEQTLLRAIASRSQPQVKGRIEQLLAYRPGVNKLRQYQISSPALNAFIHSAALQYRVDPLLVKAVIKAESNFDPNALSPKGAQGLMQLMPGTARDLAVSDPFDPLQNISGGTRYLRSLLNTFNGDVELSLAAYNAGPNRVAPYGIIPCIPETQNYVATVMRHYRAYRSIATPLPSMCNINVGQLVTVQ